MDDEFEEDISEGALQDEKIPEGLKEKWRKDEKKGLKAGLCRSCGWPFTQDEISCRHCGQGTEMSEGALVSLRRWFFKTPLGIMTFILIFVGIIIYLVH